MNTYKFITFYKTGNNNFHCYHNTTGRYETFEKIDTFENNAFFLPKLPIYKDATDENLKKYSEDLINSNISLKTFIKKHYNITFDYLKEHIQDGKISYRNNFVNVIRFFKLFCNYDILDIFEQCESPDEQEYKYIESCYNAGLIYSEKGEYKCYGYDYSAFYPSNMASETLKIPIGRGNEYKLNKLPKYIRFGFYRCKISSDNQHFKKIFSLSSDNIYTTTDIKFCIKYQEKFNINIELITDGKPNVYFYDKKFITADKLFKGWYEVIKKLKQAPELKGNILVKMLSSSLWGTLCMSNIKYMSEAEFDKTENQLKYAVKEAHLNDDLTYYYKLVNTEQFYKSNIARMKPFLTSYGRCRTAETAIMQIEDVIRVHTDGIIFKNPFKYKVDGFIPEEKTSGLLILPLNRKKNKMIIEEVDD